MRTQTLAHLSDLHVGRGSNACDAAFRLREALLDEDVGHVIVTGDVTHRGRTREADRFHELFQPLARQGKLTLIPGNHDRLNDDVRPRLMDGPRVQLEEREGLYLIRVDSTGDHNRRWIDGHGELLFDDVRQVDRLLARAPSNALCAVLLHHHPLPLPEEDPFETLVTWIGWPNARELDGGRQLMEVLRGRCDLLLHGHRHVPAEVRLFENEPRPLRVYNAGSTTELERFRVFQHREGALLGEPSWVSFTRTPAAGLIPALVHRHRWPVVPGRLGLGEPAGA
jgi:3',5'-cyclic AMP phosphodiesterase CpdA